MVVIGGCSEPQGCGGIRFLVVGNQTCGPARSTLPLLVIEVDNKGWQDRTLLPVGNLLDLAVKNRTDRVCMCGIDVILPRRLVRKAALRCSVEMTYPGFVDEDEVLVWKGELGWCPGAGCLALIDATGCHDLSKARMLLLLPVRIWLADNNITMLGERLSILDWVFCRKGDSANLPHSPAQDLAPIWGD